MFARILIGILGVAIGAFLVVKTEWMIQNFGKIAWAEAKLGAEGGTRLMYKLIGIIVIFLSFMLMTGLLGGFFLTVFGRMFGIQ